MSMDKEYFKKLTLAVYRVTEFFPEREPLRFQIRELANKILANLTPENIDNKGDLIKDAKILDACFELAEAQNWLDPRNFQVLKREYVKIQKLAEDITIFDELAVLASGGKVEENTSRHDKILEVIGSNGGAKIGELIKLFPDINRRTVLRDLDKLCQTGIVVRNGSGRGVHYIRNGQKHDNL